MDLSQFRALKADDVNLGRNHDCNKIDFARGYVCHRDCSDCGAVVFTEQSGPTVNDFDVPLDEGAVCVDCRGVSCSDCIHTLTPDGKPRCPVCYEKARILAQSGDELFYSLDRAVSDLTSYRERLKKEEDPAKIRRSITTLNRLEDLFALINQDLLPNIQRAAGLQQELLPPGDAA